MELKDLNKLELDEYKATVIDCIHNLLNLADKAGLDRNEVLQFTASHLVELANNDFSNYGV